MNKNKVACGCKHITYGMIERAVQAGATTYEEVRAKTGCGTSCGRCREFIAYLVKEFVRDMNEAQ